jgi:hypothetical protein
MENNDDATNNDIVEESQLEQVNVKRSKPRSKKQPVS